MKQKFLLLVLLLPMILQAQTLKPGYYKSQDGYITVTVDHQGDVIKMQEPTRTNEYKRESGNTYRHSEEKYSYYTIQVLDAERFNSLKNGGGAHTWTYSGKAPTAEDFLTENDGECPLAEKYQKLAEEDKSDTQVHTFCGAAALFRCNMNDEGFDAYAAQIISSLKLIMVNPSVNPCNDVFSTALWNAN